MSFKARIDRLSRELAFGERFDGATMEELSAHVFGNAPARPGVRRAVAFTGILAMWSDLHDPNRADEAMAAREELGIAADATDDEIRVQLFELAADEGLTPKEMAELRRCM